MVCQTFCSESEQRYIPHESDELICENINKTFKQMRWVLKSYTKFCFKLIHVFHKVPNIMCNTVQILQCVLQDSKCLAERIKTWTDTSKWSVLLFHYMFQGTFCYGFHLYYTPSHITVLHSFKYIISYFAVVLRHSNKIYFWKHPCFYFFFYC